MLIDRDGTNTSWEPLSQMKNADMVKLSKYAKEIRLTGKFGWKWARKFDKNKKKYVRLTKIFRSQVKEIKARYKFGIEVPRGVHDALSS